MAFVDGLLFLGACLGSTAILVFCLNRTYALPLPHKVLRLLRAVYGLLILAAPVALWYVEGIRLREVWTRGLDGTGQTALFACLMSCWVTGFVILPLVTLARHLRLQAPALQSNHTRQIDVAERLGYKPAGDGKYHFLAGLPGNEVFQVDFNEKTLLVPEALPPALDGVTILHLSDLHFCGSPDRAFYEHVMDVCREREPDLVAITGDVVDSRRHHRWVIPVLGRLRWRVAAFAILGNHDSWYEPERVRRRLRRLGMHVLGNGWREVQVNGESLVAIGNEHPWFRPRPDLSACPADAFRLCLSHTPDHIGWARENQIDLVLAGHVHGGQVRFPVVGSVFVPSAYGRRYDCGNFQEGPTTMHVSRGLGGQQPLRYNCRPEVTTLVLRAAGNAGVPTLRGARRADSVAS